jgi:hypothetical protein
VDRAKARVHVLHPVRAGDPLADEAALQIREGDEHRVDLTVDDQLLQLRLVQHRVGHDERITIRASRTQP